MWFDRDVDSHAWTHMLSSSLYGWRPVVCLQCACKAQMSIWSCCVQAYAVGFFAIPLVRWLRNKSRNAEIEQQNADRRQAAAMLVGCHCIAPPLNMRAARCQPHRQIKCLMCLQGAPRPALDAKLRAARQLGKESQRVISDRVRHACRGCTEVRIHVRRWRAVCYQLYAPRAQCLLGVQACCSMP